ncbi:MAG: FecR domain-containing protein [Bacteroidota bacterium]
MNYAHYSAAELAQDSYFQRWVLGQDTSAQKFWSKWLLEHPEKHSEVKEAIRIIQLLEFTPELEQNQHFVDVWKKVHVQTLGKPQQPRWLRAAAVWGGLMLLSGALVFWLTQSSPTQTWQTEAERGVYTLPDGSSLTLNAYSSASYQTTADGHREVRLSGEGFFRVKKRNNPGGEPTRFTVYTSTATVEVLGTTFSVTEGERSTQVVLSSGRVKVISPQQSSIQMQPGDFVEVSAQDSVLLSKQVNPQLYTSWLEDEASFEQASLPEILDWIEDRHNKAVVIDSSVNVPDSATFTATVPNGDLNVLLEALAITYKLTINQDNQSIYIEIRP